MRGGTHDDGIGQLNPDELTRRRQFLARIRKASTERQRQRIERVTTHGFLKRLAGLAEHHWKESFPAAAG